MLQSIRFADGQAVVSLLSHSQRGLQRITNAHHQTSEEFNMRIEN